MSERGTVSEVVREESAREQASARAETAAGRPALPVSPLVPVLVPVVIAAIVTGLLFAWWFPPAAPGTTPPEVRFTDVTAESGLGGWRPAAMEESPTTIGGGVVCFDYDGDGHVDVLFVGGGSWPWEDALAKRVSRGSLALFRNDGAGHFSEVTAGAGLNVELQGMMAVAGDYDGDGRVDVFVTCVGANHLFRNLGRGRFEDVTERAGVSGLENTWSTGACWIDFDEDGRLDLVVAHYARWPGEVELSAAFTVADIGRSYGAPVGFVGAFPSVYRNLGDGRFVLEPEGAGLRDVDPETGFPQAKTLAVSPVDANGDGRIDLWFTYHVAESALFVNDGGRFRRWSGAAGRRREGGSAEFALAGSLPLTAPDTDGRFGALQEASGGRREEPGEWLNLSAKLGVALLDYDLDGRRDVFSGNGRAEPDTNRFRDVRAFAAAPELRWNRGGEWVVAGPGAGEAWAEPLVARGVATADFDHDGDLDVVMAQSGAGPRVLRNEQKGGQWLRIDLVAKNGVREAPGARVEVHTPRRVHVQTVVPEVTYMAQSAAGLTFGLGDDARVRRVVVHWPDGTRQEFRPEAVNRRWSLEQR